jgi:uroporphyrinogen-III synthase
VHACAGLAEQPMAARLPKSLGQTKPVLLVRAHNNEGDAAALAELGLQPVTDPYLNIVASADAAGATRLISELSNLGEGDWVIATSANALKFWGELVSSSALAAALATAATRGVQFASVGEASARMYANFGIHRVFVPSKPYGVELAAELAALGGPGSTATMPCGNLAMPTVTAALGAAGWNMISEVVYETSTVAVRPPSADGLADEGPGGEPREPAFSALFLRSPSAARAVVEHAGVTPVPVICGGTTTASTARELGLNVARVLDAPSSTAAAQAIFDVVVGEN